MLATVMEANKTLDNNPAMKTNLAILSMDAEALYPSLALDDILEGMWTLGDTTDLEFIDVDMEEMAKFLAVVYPKE